MRSVFIIISLAVLMGCSEENDPCTCNPFGIDYSDYTNVSLANGFIMYQNYGGPRIDLAVDTAYIAETDSANYYVYQFKFTGDDSLKIIIQKLTLDYNYHSHTEIDQNKICISIFNSDTLVMDSSALSLQPRYDINAMHTVLNLHTADGKGTFNGTVDNVVLLPAF